MGPVLFVINREIQRICGLLNFALGLVPKLKKMPEISEIIYVIINLVLKSEGVFLLEQFFSTFHHLRLLIEKVCTGKILKEKLCKT